MKLLILTSSFPYPPDIGRKVVLRGFIEYAVSALGPTNVTLVCLSSGENEDYIAQCPCRVFFIPAGGILQKAGGIALHSLLLRRRAIQEMIVYSAAAQRRVGKLLDETQADVVLVDTVRMSQYFEWPLKTRARLILYLDDLYSVRYQRTIEAMNRFPDAPMDSIGTFNRFIPKPARTFVRSRTIQASLLSHESKILQRREIEMPKMFDKVLLLNPREVLELANNTGAKNIFTVKPFLPGPANRAPRSFSGDPAFVFLGNLKYPPNGYSLLLFLRRTVPVLLEKITAFRLFVVGRGASLEIQREAERFGSSVEFLDFVPNLSELMSRAAAMVIPLVFGTGIKIKALEALSSGLPIVSTTCGVDGLDLVHGRECFIANELGDFIEPMTHLLDLKLNQQMSRSVANFYERNFAANVVSHEYQRLLFDDSGRIEVS